MKNGKSVTRFPVIGQTVRKVSKEGRNMVE